MSGFSKACSLSFMAILAGIPEIGRAEMSGMGLLAQGLRNGDVSAEFRWNTGTPTQAAPRRRMGHAAVDISGHSAVAKLRSIIASAEAAGMGYDAVQHGAVIKPPAAPTQMTVQEIYDWIDATPGQQHAIGRYQFIPKTLRSLMRQGRINASTQFSPALQDRLADRLLADAGFAKFACGRMGRHDFMNNLARIWAGLPASNGRSVYAGIAGNQATISWVDYDHAMGIAFPSRQIRQNARSARCS